MQLRRKFARTLCLKCSHLIIVALWLVPNVIEILITCHYSQNFPRFHLFYICEVPRHRCSSQHKKGMSWKPDEPGLEIGLSLVLDLLPNKCAAIIQREKNKSHGTRHFVPIRRSWITQWVVEQHSLEWKWMKMWRKKGMKSRLVTGLRHVNYLESMQIYLLNSSASPLFILLLFAPPELPFVWQDFDFIVGRCCMWYRCMSAGWRILFFVFKSHSVLFVFKSLSASSNASYTTRDLHKRNVEGI